MTNQPGQTGRSWSDTPWPHDTSNRSQRWRMSMEKKRNLVWRRNRKESMSYKRYWSSYLGSLTRTQAMSRRRREKRNWRNVYQMAGCYNYTSLTNGRFIPRRWHQRCSPLTKHKLGDGDGKHRPPGNKKKKVSLKGDIKAERGMIQSGITITCMSKCFTKNNGLILKCYSHFKLNLRPSII